MNTYTGVGSRTVPTKIAKQIINIGEYLAKKGYTLRSGGADGSDTLFEAGCDKVKGEKEIYLPWKGFNGNKSQLVFPKEAEDIARKIHPAWEKLTHGSRALHSRNACQVLGFDLKSPSKFLVCYTKDGQDIGGTRTAIVLAKENSIPVFNIALEENLQKFREFCKTL